MFINPPEETESIGDLIGLAFRQYRHHFSLFLKTLIGPTLIVAGGWLSFQWLITYGLPAKNTSWLTTLVCILLIIISLVATTIGKFILTLRQLAIVRLSLGYSPNYADAYRFIKSRIWLILFVLVLVTVLIVLSLFISGLILILLALIPKIAAFTFLITVPLCILVAGASIFWLFIMYFAASMTLTTMACEDGEFNYLIGRGFMLTWSDLGRSLAFASLLGLCTAALSNPLSLPIVAVSFFEALHKGITTHELIKTSYHMPVYVMVIGQLCESLINLVIWTVTFLSFGYFYYNQRMRKEGLDILRNTTALEEQLS